MAKESLKTKLLKYLNSIDGWYKKVDLYVVADMWGYSPESAGRELRFLANEKKIQVQYYDSKFAKNLAKYARNDFKQVSLSPKFTIVEINGERKAVLVK